ncbi:MAG: DUF262 domain-containing protein [Bacteriovoracaceae bacterium]|nr:DUF262 domain-containing protein [Bacteriovoracaceae bacterium]
MDLLKNEKINSKFPEKKFSVNLSDDDINVKYTKGDVRIVTEQARYPLSTIPSMLGSGDYILRPDFQRRHRWNDRKRSKLIESLIMNVPVPPIFLYETEFSKYEVMDGLQRLTAIKKFYNDEFQLVGLELWPELNGKKYSELPSQIKKGIDRRYLSSIILLQETAKSEEEAVMLKQLVFERINSGGVKLSEMESRNALYPGPLNDLCQKLARHDLFCQLYGIPNDEDINESSEEYEETVENELYQSMKDVELVLRFFANRQRNEFDSGVLRRYLDFYLQEGNKFPMDVITSLEEIFVETCSFVYSIFGEKAFWLWRKKVKNGKETWSYYTRPTAVLYDPVMTVFSELLDRKDKIIHKKDIIQKDIQVFYQDYYSDFSGRNSNISYINKRTNLFREFMKKYV